MKRIKDRRFISGSISLIICAAAVIVAVVLNICVSLLPEGVKRIDMSASGMYKISQQTLELIAERDNIEIMYLVENGEEDLLCDQMLTRVDEQCSGITLKRIDPVLHPEDASDYTGYISGSFIVKSSIRERAVSAYDLYEYEIDGAEGYRYSYTEYREYISYYPDASVKEFFVGERKLLSALAYVSAETIPTVYFTTGHGEGDPDTTFLGYLDADNVSLSSVDTSTLTALPDNANAIVIIDPAEDFSSSECLMLKSYINSGGHVVLYTEYDFDTLPNLEGMLGELGLQRVNGLVHEGDQGMYTQDTRLLMPNTVESGFTDGVGTEAVFVPLAHGIIASDNVPDGVIITPILTTSEAAFARPLDSEETSSSMAEGDVAGPFMLGADSAIGEGSLTWYSSSYLAAEAFTYGGNAYRISDTLFLNTVEKNCGIDISVSSISSAPDKQTVADMLVVPESEKNMWSFVLIGIIPLGVLGYGFYRVRKRSRA